MDIALPEDFKEFLRLLNANGVEYLLIGGYAVSYHGYPRATNDLDIWIAASPENADRVINALSAFGFDRAQLSAGIFLKDKSLVQMGVPPIKIEITNFVSGVTFDECFPERIVDQIDGVEVSLISLPKLKINKKASGRFKDLDDLEHLS
jgi:predicted nucleotidyltransferase